MKTQSLSKRSVEVTYNPQPPAGVTRCDTPIPELMAYPNVDMEDTSEAATLPDSDQRTSFLPDNDDWDKSTTRSTAFFSARSSIFSAGSVDGANEDPEDDVAQGMLTEYSLQFPQTPELEFYESQSYI